MEANLNECIEDSDVNSIQVDNLLTEKEELNKKLEERDRTILALQRDSKNMRRKNHDLETSYAQLSRSKNNDLVKTVSDQTQNMKRLQKHIAMQSQTIAQLKDEHSVSNY